MNRASNAFSVLQATAAIVGLAILLWSFGPQSFRFAEAANVTTYSDTLSNSAPSGSSDHTITFTTPTGALNNSTITIAFPVGFTGTSSIGAADIDVATTSDFTVADNCAASDQIGVSWNNSNTLTLTFCSGDGGSLPANATTTIQIGDNATGGPANDQIVNPAGVASYEIALTVGASDTGVTEIAIVNTVNVTASVDTLFTFSVAGTAAGTSVNNDGVTGGATLSNSIPFGEIAADTASTAAQLLTVITNAKSGFVVTVTADGQLDSSTGADIDGFRNGNYDTTPVVWEGPAETLGDEDTYGHWGLTSDDNALTSGYTDIYQTGRYVSASTTPVEVFRHGGPTNGTGMGIGTTTVGYRVERSALQEAAEDYQAVLTYVATPVF